MSCRGWTIGQSARFKIPRLLVGLNKYRSPDHGGTIEIQGLQALGVVVVGATCLSLMTRQQDRHLVVVAHISRFTRPSTASSSLTGESRPVTTAPGALVSGGTLNTGAALLVVRTTATSNDSAVARLIRLVEEAQANRSRTEILVDSFARVYTPLVVLAALVMCTVPWAFGPEVGRFWTMNGLITIVSRGGRRRLRRARAARSWLMPRSLACSLSVR